MIEWSKYEEEINTYLRNKFPNHTEEKYLEATEHIVIKTMIVRNQSLQERDNEWKYQFRRRHKN